MSSQTPIKTYADFCGQHGKYVDAGSQRFFEDGAESRGDVMNLAQCFEPPTDPTKLLKAKRNFVEVKLEQEVRAFNNFKAECQQMAHWAARNSACASPHPDAADQLQRGKERIEALRKQLSELNRELIKTPEAIARRKSAEANRARRKQVNDQLSEINGISID